ncbi:protein CHUP1, chloroplastic [Tanacetum coccineum]
MTSLSKTNSPNFKQKTARMSVKYPNYVNLTSSSEEQPNERTPSPPPRKKSLSPPQALSKSIYSKNTHHTSSSSPSESPTPTHVAPLPKIRFVIPIKQESQELPPLQISPNEPYAQTIDNWPPSPSNPSPPLHVDEEEAEAFNLMDRNFRKFFLKVNRFGRGNRLGNDGNRFGKGRGNSFRNKGGESSRQKRVCYNYGVEGHFASECTKTKENKDFVREAWSDNEDGNKPQNDATCLMAIDSQPKPSFSNNDLDIIDLQKENEELLRFNKDFTRTFETLLKEKHSLESEKSKLLSKINDLEFEVKKLVNDKEVVEPCKKCDVLTKEVDSLKCNVSRLQDEALNFLKFKKSSIILDDMLSRQKLS